MTVLGEPGRIYLLNHGGLLANFEVDGHHTAGSVRSPGEAIDGVTRLDHAWMIQNHCRHNECLACLEANVGNEDKTNRKEEQVGQVINMNQKYSGLK